MADLEAATPVATGSQLQGLLNKHEAAIAAIRETGAAFLDGQDDVALLRFAVAHKGNVAAAVKNLEMVSKWRRGEGRGICQAAAKAVEQALAKGGWNNAPILASAPHAAKITTYMTASQILVTSLPNGDLCTVIRSSAIEDKAMMDEVSVEEMLDFFVYAREVHSILANKRSKERGRLVQVITANDFRNVRKAPDDRFRRVLTDASSKTDMLHPGLSGPSVVLNLPGFAQWLAVVLKPLFPGGSQLTIMKEPTSYFEDLSEVLREPIKSRFARDVTAAAGV